ncbi:MAG: dipeptidase [Planctomycetota bacterium]
MAREPRSARPIFDAHHDALQRALDLGHDLAERTPGQFDLHRALEGGVGTSVFACWVDASFGPGAAGPRAHALMDAFDDLAERRPDRLRRVRRRADLDQGPDDGAHRGILGIEGGHAIEDDLGELERFAERGLRCMTLVWNNHLAWIRSCADGGAGSPDGISSFGRDVVRRMESLGVAVDLSHAGERAFFDVMECATKPVIASHSNCKALRDHRRNLTDEQLRALAANGGVVGIVFHPGFLDAAAGEEEARVRTTDAYRRAEGTGETGRFLAQSDVMQRDAAPLSIERVVDHVEHAVAVAGPEHVGLGSDFDGIQRGPAGLEDVSMLGALVERMRARGFDEKTVDGVLGDNFRRVFSRTLPQ